MTNIFPPVSYYMLQLALRDGDLSVLGPAVQQLALQYRWLTPLFLHPAPAQLVSSWIGAHIKSMAPTFLPYHHLLFMFPVLRWGPLFMHHPGLMPILFRVFDCLFTASDVSSCLNRHL